MWPVMIRPCSMSQSYSTAAGPEERPFAVKSHEQSDLGWHSIIGGWRCELDEREAEYPSGRRRQDAFCPLGVARLPVGYSAVGLSRCAPCVLPIGVGIGTQVGGRLPVAEDGRGRGSGRGGPGCLRRSQKGLPWHFGGLRGGLWRSQCVDSPCSGLDLHGMGGECFVLAS